MSDLKTWEAITDPRNNDHSVAEVALKLAHLSVSVMPVNVVTKKPLLDTWKALQTTAANLKQVEEWFGRWPNAGLAIVTGELNGICVLDMDVGDKNEPSGWESLRGTDFLLPSASNPVPLVRTPSGGFHAYYPFDSLLPQGTRIWGLSHVDGRAEGGYVVAPPCAGYNWVSHYRTVMDGAV